MSSARGRVLVVDDDAIVADAIAACLAAAGYETATVGEGFAALETIADAEATADPYAVLVTDMSMPGMDGLELIRRLRKRESAIVPVVVTGYGTIESAIESVRQGAIDYLAKPVVDEELRVAVEKALTRHMLVAENRNLRTQIDERSSLEGIVGADPRMVRIFDQIRAVASTRSTVLMTGESGTGKSLIALAIHRHSPRADGPFVQMSCGSIPETLLESELFGHAKGAFTGAHVDKTGKFLAAHEGTIFIDEINSASPGMQLKLLRVLQERAFEPVGSNNTIEVDVRVILATNQPLEELVGRGEFRQDLYYRINVVNIQLPPLRERAGDVALLADHFLDRHAREAGRQFTGIDPDALAALVRYDLPGNVRELENIIERAVILGSGPVIHLDDLPPYVIDNSSRIRLPGAEDASDEMERGAYVPMSLADALREPERRIILQALEANDWNRQRTAEVLGINRTTLYKKIKQLGIEQYGRAG